MVKTVQVVISGKVQGVWFRANTKKQAEQKNVSGWVRNTSDGKVEAMFQGDERAVDDLISWCHQGSSMSNVSDVTAKVMDVDEEFQGFNIKY
ncbi:MAG: acylphosphatase [Thermoplasmatota archaeon]